MPLHQCMIIQHECQTFKEQFRLSFRPLKQRSSKCDWHYLVFIHITFNVYCRYNHYSQCWVAVYQINLLFWLYKSCTLLLEKHSYFHSSPNINLNHAMYLQCIGPTGCCILLNWVSHCVTSPSGRIKPHVSHEWSKIKTHIFFFLLSYAV